MPTDSPLVLIASSPHRLTLTVSGYAPSLAARCCSMMARATRAPRSAAAGEGMRYGSRAWMLRPVGSTPGPSRSRSPPTAGSRYSPLSAFIAPLSSSTLRRRSERISTASANATPPPSLLPSFPPTPSPSPSEDIAAEEEEEEGRARDLSSAARTSSNVSSAFIPATASTASSDSLSPKYADRYCAALAAVGSAPSTCSPSLNSRFSSRPRYA
mmetsp:Transcript_39448/g.97678  ORF Transcript_39448/g.97678 Transcript_39448/m.97678 type:complete len:213 (+) Transcript_39448:1229-1867(+)